MSLKEEQLKKLQAECETCMGCPLGKTRTKLVFGVGSADAQLMFVGEAPGEQEDLSGIPFVGRAGQLLRSYLSYVDIPADSVYIANVLKCRPPKNRDPLPEEEAACQEFLWEQVRIIQPKMLVCLGRIAAAKLIKPDFRITAEHGMWFEKNGKLITAVYHPAALLRNPNYKSAMLADMQEIKRKLETIV